MFVNVALLQFKNLSPGRWETINSQRFVGNPFRNFNRKSMIPATGQYFIFQMPSNVISCMPHTENQLVHLSRTLYL